MSEGSWNDAGAPRPRRGMPLWGKIALGCGGGCALFFLLLMATCIGGVHWVSKHGVPEAVDKAVGRAFLDRAWTAMDEAVRGIRTPEGSRALYRAHPGLAENYPTEDEFLKAAEEWRLHLGDFPAQRPSLGQLFQGKGGAEHFIVNTQNSTTRIEYQIPKGGRLFLQLESDKLVDLRVE